MKKNKNAETLAGILVSLVVLSIVLFWIVSMLNSQTKISDDFQWKIEEKIFKKNIENILKNIDDVENYKQEVYKITLTRWQKIWDLWIESEPEIKIEKNN